MLRWIHRIEYSVFWNIFSLIVYRKFWKQTIGSVAQFCEHSVCGKTTVWAIRRVSFFHIQWTAEQNKKHNVFVPKFSGTIRSEK